MCLNGSRRTKLNKFFYICTLSPVSESEKSVWLGDEEVRKSVIETFCADGRGQVIYDSDREFVSDEEIEQEEEGLERKVTSLSFAKVGE